MLTFTEKAKERISSFLDAQREQGVTALRVAGNVREPKLWLMKESDRQHGDEVFDIGPFQVFIDPLSMAQLQGATVDFVESVMQSGFRVFYPSPTWDDPVMQRAQEVLDQDINPGVAGHGGRIELVRREGDTLYISMEGGCQGCGAASVTLRQGVEVRLKEAVPEIQRIMDITDHAAGENPYYRPADEKAESPLG